MSKSQFACASIGVVIACGVVAGQSTNLASVDSGGAQGDSESQYAAISDDGNCIAFLSWASNLVPGDTNGIQDVFVRDRATGTTERVSVDSSGGECIFPGPGVWLSISIDGRFVAFDGETSNLVPGDSNMAQDVFVRDRQNGTTERVSVSTSGVEGNYYSQAPSISADGRFVAFASFASNLVAGDTNGSTDIFVRDRQNSTTERVSVHGSGLQANGACALPSISPDGRFVAFQSSASNLVTGDSNGVQDVFVRDRATGTTERVSIDSLGAQGNSFCDTSSISDNGRFVAFSSEATNLVLGDTNAVRDIFVRDRASGTTERVSVTSGGIQANGYSFAPSISASGDSITFGSTASNLVAGDTNAFADVFVHVRSNGTTERVSVHSSGAQGNNASYVGSISADGRVVAFWSSASNLVAGDTNGFIDSFVHERWSLPNVYCTAGTTTHGCTGELTANTQPSVSLAYACNITVTNVEGQKSGILFYGIDNAGFTPGPWAAGSTSVLCVKHPTQRTPIQNSGGTFNACDGSFVLDWNAYQSTHPLALGNPWSVGDKVYVQAWFRDPPAVKSTNLSNALEMTYVP